MAQGQYCRGRTARGEQRGPSRNEIEISSSPESQSSEKKASRRQPSGIRSDEDGRKQISSGKKERRAVVLCLFLGCRRDRRLLVCCDLARGKWTGWIDFGWKVGCFLSQMWCESVCSARPCKCSWHLLLQLDLADSTRRMSNCSFEQPG